MFGKRKLKAECGKKMRSIQPYLEKDGGGNAE